MACIIGLQWGALHVRAWSHTCWAGLGGAALLGLATHPVNTPHPFFPAPQCEYLGAPERSITLNFSKSATNSEWESQAWSSAVLERAGHAATSRLLLEGEMGVQSAMPVQAAHPPPQLCHSSRVSLAHPAACPPSRCPAVVAQYYQFLRLGFSG